MTLSAFIFSSGAIKTILIYTSEAGILIEPKTRIAAIALHILACLACPASRTTSSASICVDVSGVSFKAGQTKIIPITIEASLLTEIVYFG